jgi:replicative DNA helicase
MKLLPSSPEAERGVIGSIMLRPQDALALCAELSVIPEHFNAPAHQLIFGTLCRMWNSRKEVDPVTLMTELSDSRELETVGARSGSFGRLSESGRARLKRLTTHRTNRNRWSRISRRAR